MPDYLFDQGKNKIQGSPKTTVDAIGTEINNVRIGANGITYATAGLAVRGQFDDMTNALNFDQTKLLETGNIQNNTGETSAGTSRVRSIDYLKVKNLIVNKPAGVELYVFYYQNPTEENNGFLGYLTWTTAEDITKNVYSNVYAAATHVKIRFAVSGQNPLTPDYLFNTAGVTIYYYISSLSLYNDVNHNILVYLSNGNLCFEQSAEFVENAYYKASKNANSSYDYFKLNVTSGTTYYINGKVRFISKDGVNINDYSNGVINPTFTPDFTGAAYITFFKTNPNYIISLNNDLANIGTFQNPTYRQQYVTSILNGKKWVACGDSFTHGDFSGIADETLYKFQNQPYAGQMKVYPFIIGRATNCNVQNMAVNGATMAVVSGRDNCFSTDNGLYTQIDADADYITLYFGINDSHQNVPIGTINDTVNTTFYGAWNVVMQYLITNHPNAKIGIIISNGCDSIDYPNATIAIAKKYGVAYLDINGDYNVPFLFRTNGKPDVDAAVLAARNAQYYVTETNHHPNVAAHEYESTIIQKWLESI